MDSLSSESRKQRHRFSRCMHPAQLISKEHGRLQFLRRQPLQHVAKLPYDGSKGDSQHEFNEWIKES